MRKHETPVHASDLTRQGFLPASALDGLECDRP